MYSRIRVRSYLNCYEVTTMVEKVKLQYISRQLLLAHLEEVAWNVCFRNVVCKSSDLPFDSARSKDGCEWQAIFEQFENLLITVKPAN